MTIIEACQSRLLSDYSWISVHRFSKAQRKDKLIIKYDCFMTDKVAIKKNEFQLNYLKQQNASSFNLQLYYILMLNNVQNIRYHYQVGKIKFCSYDILVLNPPLVFFQSDNINFTKHWHIHNRFRRIILHTNEHTLASFQECFQNYALKQLIQVFNVKQLGSIVPSSCIWILIKPVF